MEKMLPPLELFWELSEITHMKCLVSVQEASSVFRFYCTEWVGGIITQWFKEEMEPELGDADTSDDEW